MMAQALPRLTPEEYLERERASETRSEYLDGETFAMSGASRQHNRINWNLAVALDPQLKSRGCEGFSNDMRVKIPSGLFTYPDLAVVCGEPSFADDHLDTLLNPLALVEILSPSTEDYDRGRKFAHYRTLTSLKTYVVIAQDRIHVERYERQDDASWHLTETEDPRTVLELPTIGARISVEQIYDRVEM